MSCGDHHDTPCDQVLPNIILYIDHEIFDNNQLNAVEIHFDLCYNCGIFGQPVHHGSQGNTVTNDVVYLPVDVCNIFGSKQAVTTRESVGGIVVPHSFALAKLS